MPSPRPWLNDLAKRLGVTCAVAQKVRFSDRSVEVGFADPELFAGRPVLLVDDIASTGGTLVACAKALAAAGAERLTLSSSMRCSPQSWPASSSAPAFAPSVRQTACRIRPMRSCSMTPMSPHCAARSAELIVRNEHHEPDRPILWSGTHGHRFLLPVRHRIGAVAGGLRSVSRAENLEGIELWRLSLPCLADIDAYGLTLISTTAACCRSWCWKDFRRSDQGHARHDRFLCLISCPMPEAFRNSEVATLNRRNTARGDRRSRQSTPRPMRSHRSTYSVRSNTRHGSRSCAAFALATGTRAISSALRPSSGIRRRGPGRTVIASSGLRRHRFRCQAAPTRP